MFDEESNLQVLLKGILLFYSNILEEWKHSCFIDRSFYNRSLPENIYTYQCMGGGAIILIGQGIL